ncbi:MAG TPA: ergothioneine biosynthesis protein EgtB [Burkholderiaceae bacterium]|nr:ergothioneine biosynthesis protein EgtB [Burkholderiaceae bacterium]
MRAEPARPGVSAAAPAPLLDRFRAVRSASVQLAGELSAEDQCVQSMPEASPIKWHLAHTSWFFEALVLQAHDPGYRCFDERYARLFNSYYEALGPRHARELRGLLTRPSHRDVLRYRRHVDRAVAKLVGAGAAGGQATPLLELGLNHEQQHQELMLTDIKHAFYLNPLRPAYRRLEPAAVREPAPLRWDAHRGGVQQVGHAGSGFAFDNESPRHAVLLRPFQLASRAVSCAEYLDFVLDGGYRRPELWLSDGWATVKKQGWDAPLYWEADGGGRFNVFTLHGTQPLNPGEAVCHLSFYEACAYASWAQARLPTEFEWEAAAAAWPGLPPGATSPRLHPEPADAVGGSASMRAAVWQWTRSSYDPYPGFRPSADPVGEYNGKFMVGQLVLRGGSFATPPGHIRITYRNYFPPGARWQFSGLRLARDA